MLREIEPTATAGRLHVDSEVGTLRRVILHRPDLELRRLTPRNREALLFDDVLWVKRARQEHDGFADALVERGVAVHLLGDLLVEMLEDDTARNEVVQRTMRTADIGPALSDAVREWFMGLPAHELAQRLIGGVALDELPFTSRSLSALLARADGFVLDPLPNHMFTRDTSAWIFNGVSVHAMAKPARRREAVPGLQRCDGLHHAGADDRDHLRRSVSVLGAGAAEVAPARSPAGRDASPRSRRDRRRPGRGLLGPLHLVLALHRSGFLDLLGALLPDHRRVCARRPGLQGTAPRDDRARRDAPLPADRQSGRGH
jgi:hypothetical protein